MLHHLGVFASDFDASREFYRAALGVLGIEVGYETAGIAEFWRAGTDTPSLSLERAAGQPTHGLHLAFAAPDRAHVDQFFRVAVEAGGRERVAPSSGQSIGRTAPSSATPTGTTSRPFTRRLAERRPALPGVAGQQAGLARRDQ